MPQCGPWLQSLRIGLLLTSLGLFQLLAVPQIGSLSGGTLFFVFSLKTFHLQFLLWL